jgi:hypothetical protein
VFTKDGKPIVYIQAAKGYQERSIEVLARNPDEVAVSGLEPGTMVALLEPEASEK